MQVLFSGMPIALPHAKAGKLRALAVTGAHAARIRDADGRRIRRAGLRAR